MCENVSLPLWVWRTRHDLGFLGWLWIWQFCESLSWMLILSVQCCRSMSVNMCARVCIHTCVYLWVCIHICASMCVYIYVYLCVSVCVYTYMCVRVCVHIYVVLGRRCCFIFLYKKNECLVSVTDAASRHFKILLQVWPGPGVCESLGRQWERQGPRPSLAPLKRHLHCDNVPGGPAWTLKFDTLSCEVRWKAFVAGGGMMKRNCKIWIIVGAGWRVFGFCCTVLSTNCAE